MRILCTLKDLYNLKNSDTPIELIQALETKFYHLYEHLNKGQPLKSFSLDEVLGPIVIIESSHEIKIQEDYLVFSVKNVSIKAKPTWCDKRLYNNREIYNVCINLHHNRIIELYIYSSAMHFGLLNL